MNLVRSVVVRYLLRGLEATAIRNALRAARYPRVHPSRRVFSMSEKVDLAVSRHTIGNWRRRRLASWLLSLDLFPEIEELPDEVVQEPLMLVESLLRVQAGLARPHVAEPHVPHVALPSFERLPHAD